MVASRNPLVSVCILTWNRRDHLIKAVESVLNQPYSPVEIVVVDSASTDGTDELMASRYPDLKYIRLHRNAGCPEGRNIALANCSGEIIYALDDDGWVANDTLHVCVDRMERFPRVGVVGSKILAPDEPHGEAAADTLHYIFSGGASAIRREVLERAGYYPSDFFRQGEEADLALRIFDCGYEILSCPGAVMYHERSPINRDDKRFLYYSMRNELYTVVRRYPLVYLIPAAIQKIVTWNYLGLRRLSLHYSAAGMLAALVRLPELLRDRRPVSRSAVRREWALKLKARQRAASHGRGAVRDGAEEARG